MRFGKNKKKAPSDKLTLPKALDIIRESSMRATGTQNYALGVRQWTQDLFPVFEAMGIQPPYFEGLLAKLDAMYRDPESSHREAVHDTLHAYRAAGDHLAAVAAMDQRAAQMSAEKADLERSVRDMRKKLKDPHVRKLLEANEKPIPKGELRKRFVESAVKRDGEKVREAAKKASAPKPKAAKAPKEAKKASAPKPKAAKAPKEAKKASAPKPKAAKAPKEAKKASAPKAKAPKEAPKPKAPKSPKKP